jgi:hypothetical protein
MTERTRTADGGVDRQETTNQSPFAASGTERRKRSGDGSRRRSQIGLSGGDGNARFIRAIDREVEWLCQGPHAAGIAKRQPMLRDRSCMAMQQLSHPDWIDAPGNTCNGTRISLWR